MQTMQKIPTPKVAVKTQVSRWRQRVGLLGGTFNPPHLAHLMMAHQVGEQLGLKRVDLMPDNRPPHVDKKEAIDASDRLAMVNLAVADDPLLGVEPCEINRGGISYSVDTIKYLQQKNPQVDYYFIIGGDMVEYLPKWHKIDELVKLVQFVAVARPNYRVASPYPLMWVDSPQLEISSTVIRQKIATGRSIKYFVPDNVADYIYEKGLYRNANN